MRTKSCEFYFSLILLLFTVNPAVSQSGSLSCLVPPSSRTISSKTGVLKAPRINGLYPPNQICDWTFQVDPKKEILVITIGRLDLESKTNLCPQTGFCGQNNCVDQLELLPGQNDTRILCGTTITPRCYVIQTSATSAFSASTIRRFCGSVNGFLTSSNNEIKLRFYANSANQKSGFTLAYNIANIPTGVQMEPPMFDPTQAPPIPSSTTNSTTTVISTSPKSTTSITASTTPTPSTIETTTTKMKTRTESSTTTVVAVPSSTGREILYVMAGVVAFLMVGTTLAVVILCVRRSARNKPAHPRQSNEESENLNPYDMSEPVPYNHTTTTTTTFRQLVKSDGSCKSTSRSYVAANDVTVFEKGRVITDRDVYCCVSVTEKPESEKKMVDNILYESAEIPANRTGSYNNNMENRTLPTPPNESKKTDV